MAETDHSFFDNFSDHLQSTVGQQAQGLSQLKIENAKMNSNKNLSGETNAAGDSMHFEYDNDLLTKEVWRTGLTWQF